VFWSTDGLMALGLDSGHQVKPLVQTPFLERNGKISPDGRWLAYEANDSGEYEIYVRPFPDVNSQRWKVSNGGGTQPSWSRTSEELFYVVPPGSLVSVRVPHGNGWSGAATTKLFEGSYFTNYGGSTTRTYDVSPDGRRFLATKFAEEQQTGSASLVIVQNWLEELKQKASGR
jgi:Tol biopolymer transport system component